MSLPAQDNMLPKF